MEEHPLSQSRDALARRGCAVQARPSTRRLVTPRVVAEEGCGLAAQLHAAAVALPPTLAFTLQLIGGALAEQATLVAADLCRTHVRHVRRATRDVEFDADVV